MRALQTVVTDLLAKSLQSMSTAGYSRRTVSFGLTFLSLEQRSAQCLHPSSTR